MVVDDNDCCSLEVVGVDADDDDDDEECTSIDVVVDDNFDDAAVAID